jgi:peptidylprolyl isomerase
MNRFSAFALSCFLALALAGCSSDKGADAGGATAGSTPPATAPTTPPPAGDTASNTPPAGAPDQKPQGATDAKGADDAKGDTSKPETDKPKDGKAADKDKTAAPKSGAAKGGKVVTTASGLQYEDIKVGTGPSPQSGQQVTVDYDGRLADGTKFDSSYDKGTPFSFIIGQHQVIAGWDEGVMSMKVGGKRKLIIPPGLAYGDSPPPGAPIPPGATLTFIVELHGVQ